MSITNEPLPNSEILRDMQILVVDNECDSRDLYAFILEGYGAKVTAIGSIKDALNLLSCYIPVILICETRFLGESVYPLIQRIRSLALSSGKVIPILVTSTCSPTSFAQQLKLKVEAYLLKPVEIDCFIAEVWNLALLPSIIYPSSTHDWIMKQKLDRRFGCGALVE